MSANYIVHDPVLPKITYCTYSVEYTNSPSGMTYLVSDSRTGDNSLQVNTAQEAVMLCTMMATMRGIYGNYE